MPRMAGRLLRRDVDGAIRHPTCRRPAPGRRARWLEIQGPVPTGSGETASNGGGGAARLQWLKADAKVTGARPRPERKPKNGTGHQDAAARVPNGNPLRRAKALHWLPTRHPRARRTLAGTADGAGRVGAREADKPVQITCKAL